MEVGQTNYNNIIRNSKRWEGSKVSGYYISERIGPTRSLCSVSFRRNFSSPLRIGSCTGQSYQRGKEILQCPVPSLWGISQGTVAFVDWISNNACEP